MVVPQVSQTALVAFLPFFIVTACAFLPSLFVRHLTQYIINCHPPSKDSSCQLSYIHFTLQTKYTTNSRLRMKLTRIRLLIMSDLTFLPEPSCANISAFFAFRVLVFAAKSCSFNCPLTLEAKPLFFEAESLSFFVLLAIFLHFNHLFFLTQVATFA